MQLNQWRFGRDGSRVIPIPLYPTPMTISLYTITITVPQQPLINNNIAQQIYRHFCFFSLFSYDFLFFFFYIFLFGFLFDFVFLAFLFSSLIKFNDALTEIYNHLEIIWWVLNSELITRYSCHKNIVSPLKIWH